MSLLPIAKWRTKKTVIFLHILIHQTTFAKAGVEGSGHGCEDISSDLACPAPNVNTRNRKNSERLENVGSLEECADKCREKESCNFWSWAHQDAGKYSFRCSLMSGYGRTTKDTKIISGDKCCKPGELAVKCPTLTVDGADYADCNGDYGVSAARLWLEPSHPLYRHKTKDRFIFWYPGGPGWFIGTKAYLETGLYFHSSGVDTVEPWEAEWEKGVTVECKGQKVDGAWSAWGAFGTCSVTCGDGTKTRERTCNSPIPANGGNDCSGSPQETMSCNHGDCPGLDEDGIDGEVAGLDEDGIDGEVGEGRGWDPSTIEGLPPLIMNIRDSSKCCEECQKGQPATQIFEFNTVFKFCSCYKTISGNRPRSIHGQSNSNIGICSSRPNCSQYDINNLPQPRFILLGPTGIGKSTLANQLLGRNPFNVSEQAFSVGHGVQSHTIDISWQVGNWLGDGPCFTIIDTPGTSDSEGRDYEHALAMANIMKDTIKSVNIFLLCFSGEDLRFHQSIVDLLKLYESIFSKEMWKHAVTAVTFWSHDKRSKMRRKRNRKMTEATRHKEWNSQYKEELNVTIEIHSVYIDPVLPIFDDEAKEYIEPIEIKQFEKYTGELFQYGKDTPPFYCEGNCEAPNGYFLGNPWIKKKSITERQGEKTEIICQIWNGIVGKASNNVTWTHDGEIIYEKTTSEFGEETFSNSTDVWGSQVKFVETSSPGDGYFTDFSIEFEALEESMEGNYTCENGKESDNNVAEVFMKVDGSWGDWGPWGQCSKSCLGEDNQMGYKKRSREAVPPRNGGNPVDPLDGEDTQVCAGEEGPENPVLCPKDFSWNQWTQWSECSPKCGNGTTSRVRSCNQGANGGAMCPLPDQVNLSEQESKDCKIKDCPDCIQLEWQEWSQCSKTCITENQPGTRIRQRTTKEADPNNPKCNPDDHSQQESCNTIHCPIDGRISPWLDWSPTSCNETCKSDTQSPPDQSRTRFCIAPQYGGNPCPPFTSQNPKTETRDCPNTWHCPIDCQWGWSAWSTCSRKCGTGEKTRTKTVLNLAEHGGKNCTGLKEPETGTCFERQCPPCRRGSWTSWSPTCPQRCGYHAQQRTRRWMNPANYQQLGGSIENCYTKAHDIQRQSCNGYRILLAKAEWKKKGKDGKYHNWKYDEVVQYCAKHPNARELPECFAKGSKVTTPQGEKQIEDLRLGDDILTLKNNLAHFTPFLGWLHKENNSNTQFVTLKTRSQHITMSYKHVIFSKRYFSQKRPDAVFADNVMVGNYLQVLDGVEQTWEEVIAAEESVGSGIYAPLTGEGTILVDNILASCYAEFTLQSVGDFAFLPIRMFPGLLDNEVSQHEDGLRNYTKFLIQLVKMLSVVENAKTENTSQPNVGQMLVLIAFLCKRK